MAYAVAAVVVVAALAVYGILRRKHMTHWIGPYCADRLRRRQPVDGPVHVMFCFVDHFEPGWRRPSPEVERERVRRWAEGYPALCARHRDADGRAPIHTFFYPEEEYRPEHIDALVGLCRRGLGEIEVHLHHDHDTAEGLSAKLRRFVSTLAERHDALPRDPASGALRWAFVHGNWALDNSRPDGRWCGVDDELPVLAREGCYADFTLPSAPDPTQTRTVNRIYYATGRPGCRKNHDTGVEVAVGREPTGDLMIVQGPLRLNWRRRKFGLLPKIENADIKASNPPTPDRIDLWIDAAIHVAGRPEWRFVKVHTHGTQDGDIDALLGGPVDRMHDYLESRYNDGQRYVLHYVSARETYNIIKAAEEGRSGDPSAYRDYRIPRPGYAVRG